MKIHQLIDTLNDIEDDGHDVVILVNSEQYHISDGVMSLGNFVIFCTKEKPSITFDKYDDFQDAINYLDISNRAKEEVILSGEGLPCYVSWLENANYIEESDITTLLECAFYFTADNESLIMVSVTSNETPATQYWLDAAEGYPGAVVTTIQRSKRTVYNILFPATPSL